MDFNPPPDAVARKARSIQQLRRERVPVYDHLPTIEGEATSPRRRVEEVLERSVALVCVAVKGESADDALGDYVCKYCDASAFLTPREHDYLSNRDRLDRDHKQFHWRYEAAHVGYWALGLVQELGRPVSLCDVTHLSVLLKDHRVDGLLEMAKLRPQAELLDAADLTYRYHWAARNEMLVGGRAPAGLNAGVILERHWMLSWLTRSNCPGWDQIDVSI
ncbi:MAG: DUF4272 domain-containing protein [Pseudomonadota bacterium]